MCRSPLLVQSLDENIGLRLGTWLIPQFTFPSAPQKHQHCLGHPSPTKGVLLSVSWQCLCSSLFPTNRFCSAPSATCNKPVCEESLLRRRGVGPGLLHRSVRSSCSKAGGEGGAGSSSSSGSSESLSPTTNAVAGRAGWPERGNDILMPLETWNEKTG